MKAKIGLACLMALAAGLMAVSANAAVSVSFDAADSNIGAGLYDFTLSGAPASATLSDFNSTFTITGWAAPAVGNSASLLATRAPSAWNLTQNDSNNARWILESYTAPNNAVDGRFEVRGTPNLHGTLLWQLAWLPGNAGFTGSGNVTIGAVPESGGYGLFAVAGLLVAVIGPHWKSHRAGRHQCNT